MPRQKTHPGFFAPNASVPVRAAVYVRMSTEHQKYSTTNQLNAIIQYAAARGLEIAQIYEDSGRSGLTFDGRAALKRLVQDILGGVADFTEILVYDVSRWGRFQDPDEAAYYEHLCRRRGIHICYCAEPFDNDGSPLAVIMKSVKRAMAAEFSRELSVKVHATLCQLTRMGCNAGSQCVYGLSRVVVDEHGKPKRVLRPGQMKDMKSDRVVLAPGRPEQISVVRQIFGLYADSEWSTEKIAQYLNERNVPTHSARRWHHSTVLYILQNEKYLGVQFYNRTSAKLKGKKIKNESSQWVRTPGAFAGIVDLGLFQRAQDVRLRRGGMKTDQQLLDDLKAFLGMNGKISHRRIRAALGLADSQTYINRFGSLRRAYALVGYPDLPNYRVYEEMLYRRQMRLQLLEELKREIVTAGGSMTFYGIAHDFIVNERTNGYFQLMKSCGRNSFSPTWKMRFLEPSDIDLYLFGRLLSAEDSAPIDYYAIPSVEVGCTTWTMHLKNGAMDAYRFADLGRLAAHLVKGNLLATSYNGSPKLPGGNCLPKGPRG
jgi:hypothetical protein